MTKEQLHEASKKGWEAFTKEHQTHFAMIDPEVMKYLLLVYTSGFADGGKFTTTYIKEEFDKTFLNK